MHKIDGAGHVGNQFVSEDAGTNRPPTEVTADWMNAVQNELAEVVTGAGLLLNKSDNTQLRQSISKMIQAGQRTVIINNAVFAPAVTGAGKPVYWDAANNRFDLALADGSAKQNCVGFGDVANSNIHSFGDVALFAGLTPGSRYYLDSAVAGVMTTTPPTNAVTLGIARTASEMFVDIDSLSGGVSANANNSFTKAQRGAVSPLAYGATITPDFSASNNYSLTLSGNATLATPSNLTPGQSGAIAITQDATGGRTMAFSACFKFIGGYVPSLTATPGAIDVLTYYVFSGAQVYAALMKDVK